MRLTRLLGAVVAPFLLANCASLVEGTDQSVTVFTDPAGATCRLERTGTVLAVVNPTPGSVTIGKSRHDVTVHCEKDRFEPGTATLESKFQVMTLGNAIFGGLIGVAIDAGSGAANKYPGSISLVLTPRQFSQANRDTAYDRLRSLALQR